jgi:hypothetical protein
MFIFVEGIDYAKESIHDFKWVESRFKSCDPGMVGYHQVIIESLDMKELPDLINDIVYRHKLSQPCNLSIYAKNVKNIQFRSVVIKDILH